MSEASLDAIIVGQGLAGTTLAWRLRAAGARVLVMDQDAPVTSSKIAAGLMTPITGKNLTLSRQCDAFFAAARAFYPSVERETGRTFFHDRVAVRLLATQKERTKWDGRRLQPDYRHYLLSPQPSPLIDPQVASSERGGFAMHAAQLDAAAYLEASREALDCETANLDWERDVTVSGDGVRVLGHEARHIISCEGYAAVRNPYFSRIRFRAAKGDILTVRFHRPLPYQSLHRGIWVAPTNEADVFRVGATYDWDNLDQEPGRAARETIEAALKAFVHVPYEVIGHRAAVRPIIRESRALIGFHPEHVRVGYFNGLGSKGALHAPLYADRLAQHILDGVPLPPDMDVRQHLQGHDAHH